MPHRSLHHIDILHTQENIAFFEIRPPINFIGEGNEAPEKLGSLALKLLDKSLGNGELLGGAVEFTHHDPVELVTRGHAIYPRLTETGSHAVLKDTLWLVLNGEPAPRGGGGSEM